MHKVERLNDSQVKITVTVPVEQVERGMRHAAEHMTENTTIPGFRPGKAPYEVVKERIGEMKLLEHAAEELIRATLSAALIEEDLSIVGQPYFTVEKMVPGNELIYSAEIALMPHVKKLADYETLTVKAEDTSATDEVFEQAKKDLLRMRTTEVRAGKDHELAKGNKTVVNLTMKREGVVLEGGEAQNHGIYTGEPYYIEGFIEQIVGAKEGEERSFKLKFPKDHYQKHLAGQDVDFTVKINEIFTLEIPAYDETFAAALGFKDIAEMEGKLRENLRDEKVDQETRRQEKAALELLAEKSDFSDIGDLLINQEIDKMIFELRQWVTQNGMEFDEYLKSVKKSVPDLKLDFAKQALVRIKVALILEEVAKKEKIAPTPEEIDAEVDRIGEAVAKDPAAKEHVYSPAYRDRVETQLRNRKTVDFLKAKMVK
ncbi:MAG TPA: trigger factor [bacterium]|nr:trigger factor [bacterium]